MFRKISFICILLALLLLTKPAFAQVLDTGLVDAAETGAGYSNSNLEVTIGYFISILIGVLGIIFLLLALYAGFTWMTAMGDAKKIETAKSTLARAVVGLAIVLSAYAITSFVVNSLAPNQNYRYDSSGNLYDNRGNLVPNSDSGEVNISDI
jgi:uncharacterized membrane protein